MHCIQLLLYATPQDVLENNTYNGQECQQGVLGRRHGIIRVGMIAPAGQQDPLGLVLVVHLLERHGGFTSSYALCFLEVEFGQMDTDTDIRSQDNSQDGSRNAVASCCRPRERRRRSIVLPLWHKVQGMGPPIMHAGQFRPFRFRPSSCRCSGRK